MQNEERRRPTNGDTDDDDSDIYRKAANAELVKLAATAKAVLEATSELVDAATNAVLALPAVDSPRVGVCYDKYSERLAATARLVLFQRGELADAAEPAVHILKILDSPEAKERATTLKTVLTKFPKSTR